MRYPKSPSERSERAESFRTRIFSAFVLFIMLASTAFTLFSVYSQSQEVEEKLFRKGELLATLLSSSSRTGVFAENRESLRDAAAGVIAQEDVQSLAVYTADNRELLVDAKPVTGKRALLLPRGDQTIASRLQEGSALEVIRDKDRITFFKPIMIETPPSIEEALYFDVDKSRRSEMMIGYVQVTMDRGIIKQEVKSIFTRNVLLAILFVVSGTITIYIVLRRVTRPLTTLAQRVRSFGKGASLEKIPVESRDEIGKLTEAFNAMTEDLRKREEEKQAMEEKLRHAEKMEAVGRLARGIAHDFNNILTTVEGSLFIMKKKVTEDGSLTQYADQMHKSISKMRGLIQGLLAFSKTQVINLMPVDLAKAIRKLLPMLKDLAGERVQIELSLCDDPCMVMADPLQMDQVLMNLCTNSRDAMPEGGHLAIRTETVSLPHGYSASHSIIGSGRYVRLSVSDTGIGMDGKTRERIFEPFFTTKETGKGTGLGLSIVLGIVEQHRGHIDIQSSPGKGTEFTIYFPMLEKCGDSVDNKRTV